VGISGLKMRTTMLVDIARAVSRTFLPSGREFRTLPFGPASGCTMKINYHYDMRLYLGLYEIETQRWFRRMIKKGYRSFDVGGAGGYDALLLSKLAGGTEVISFECEEIAVIDMVETFKRNRYPITAVKAFVSNCDYDDEITLDSASRKYFVPDFIKLDIEGAEDRALSGASDIIASRKPNMIVEVHGKETEERCQAILTGYGYIPIVIDRMKIFGEKRPMSHNRWLICRGRDF
jgi:Methyltransferase FkbM domain